MSYTYLELALSQLPLANNLSLKPGQKDLEERFKIELTIYGPNILPELKMKLNAAFMMLVAHGLTTEKVNELVENGAEYPLLSTVMFTLVSVMLMQKGVLPDQLMNNAGLMSQLVFTDQEVDRLYLAITNH